MNKHNAETLKGQTLIHISVEMGVNNGKAYHLINQRPVKVNNLSNIGPCKGCDIVIDGNSTLAAYIYENDQPEFLKHAGSAFFLFPKKSGTMSGYCFRENVEAATKKLSTALLDALDDKIEALRADLKLAESLESYMANL